MGLSPTLSHFFVLSLGRTIKKHMLTYIYIYVCVCVCVYIFTWVEWRTRAIIPLAPKAPTTVCRYPKA
jgi:hypothetical protein